MTTEGFCESCVGEATLEWFGGLGYAVARGEDEDIAPERAGPMGRPGSPKLLSGEIRVIDATQLVEEVERGMAARPNM